MAGLSAATSAALMQGVAQAAENAELVSRLFISLIQRI